MVKLPVGYHEYFWIKRLGLVGEPRWDEVSSLALPTPRVLAAGFELAGYDLAWVVMEKLSGATLAAEGSGQSVWEIFETAAEFHAAAITERPIEPELAPPPPDWITLMRKALEAAEDNGLEPADRWRASLTAALDAAPALAQRWAARDIDTWCHLDLHARNAMRRVSDDDGHHGRCVLIDLAMVRPGSWVEDALYLERLYWGHEDHLHGVDPVSALATARQFNGLTVGDDAQELADVRRILMAATAPAFLSTEGDPRYLETALAVLERLLPRVRAA